MRFRNSLFLPLLVIVLVLTAGQLWAVPVITIFNVKTTSPNGILDRDFRIGEVVKYKIRYNFSALSPDPRAVTGTVKVEFADGCVRKYEKVVGSVNPDESRWMVLRRKIPVCSSVANWVTVTYSIKVGSSTESESGAIFVYPPLEPIARFTATPRYGVAPLAVYFSNKSLGTVETFDWDFDDGETSNLPNPSHVYDEAGQYSVSLTINDPDGDTKTKTDYITVVDPATVLDAKFRAPRSQRAVLWEDTLVTVNFKDRTAGAPDSWEWDFSYDEDDGFNIESTDQHPNHDYTEAGLYSVVLKVYDSVNVLEDRKTKWNYISIYEE